MYIVESARGGYNEVEFNRTGGVDPAFCIEIKKFFLLAAWNFRFVALKPRPSSTVQVFDIAVIGGGIVGVGAAMAVIKSFDRSLVVLEGGLRLGSHQTGHNSGVIHSGLYYTPGSLKARLCTEGREQIYRFCDEHGVQYEKCGKVVVATEQEELPRLQALRDKAAANGLRSVSELSPEQIREHEPFVNGIAGLHIPETGIVDYRRVTEAMAKCVRNLGGEIRTKSMVTSIRRRDATFLLETDSGEVECRMIINCAGLQSDRVARLCGIVPNVQILPFRGEYYRLTSDGQRRVRNLVYPVPDPRFPFLGVHFTRMIEGGVEAGPNAVLAGARHGYRWTDFSARDSLETACYTGTWRMAGRYWKTGAAEVWRSLSKRSFLVSLQRLVPTLRLEDLAPGGSGVRAQAVQRDGRLVDDFRIMQAERSIHVLNAPSPAATASISIGRYIADVAGRAWTLRQK